MGEIHILSPGYELIVLSGFPTTYQNLLNDIAAKLGVEAETVRVTYSNRAGKRLMLLGEQRYLQALEDCQDKVLRISVILVPVSATNLDTHFLDLMIHTPESPKEELSSQENLETSSQVDPFSEVKRRISEILNNSQHYLSPKFKSALHVLMVPGMLASRKIDLSEANIDSYECQLVSELLQYLPNTRELNLKSNHIGNDGFSQICQELVKMRDLEVLDLSRNCISSSGVPGLITTIQSIPSLTFLSLSFNPLTSDDFETVVTSVPRTCRIVQHKTEKCEIC